MNKKLYPFQSKNLTIGDLQYHYVDEGEGHPVIMVHGNPTWSFFYRNVISELKNDYRCIAVDHIGCGLSSKPQNYDYILKNHIKNLISLVDALDLQTFDLILHDWGGAIGMGLATHFSDRVRRIIPMNTAAFILPYMPKRIKLFRLPIFGRIAIQSFNVFARAATIMTTVKPLSREVKQGYLFPYDNFANRRATYEFVVDIPLSSYHQSWGVLKDIELGLRKFSDQQFCFIWGMKDWCFDKRALAYWQTFFPLAKTYTYKDAGHYLLEDRSDDIIENIRFFLDK